MKIRSAEARDYDAVWDIFHDIVSRGETYAFAPDMTRNQGLEAWVKKPTATYVAEVRSEIAGTYYIKPNQPALGAHVCNCGYMVASHLRGQGIATAMCEHSQVEARRLGFKAMQFNLVVSTNVGAVRLWQKIGFHIVDTLPRAFNHRTLDLVGAYVMYKWLA